MKNIELFDIYTGKILAKLYENFERDGIGEKIRDAVIRGKNEAIRAGVSMALRHALSKGIGM